MDKIKRFVECLIPITSCNLKCSYCYIIQRKNRTLKNAVFKYTPKQIDIAMDKTRWGGLVILVYVEQVKQLYKKE